MSDLISRQAAIDALRYAQHRFTVADEAGGMGTVKWSEDVIYFAAAEMVLTELPSAQQWIPCSERLPEDKNSRYWICTDGGYQCQCRWTNNIFGIGETDRWGWSIFDIPQYSKVIAWMPLPEPYRMEEGDKDV